MKDMATLELQLSRARDEKKALVAIGEEILDNEMHHLGDK